MCKSVIYHSLWPVFPGRRRKRIRRKEEKENEEEEVKIFERISFFVLKSNFKNNNKVFL